MACQHKKMHNQRKDPYGNYRFIVEINGIAQANFSEVILPDSASEVIEHREGTTTNTFKNKLGRRRLATLFWYGVLRHLWSSIIGVN